MGTSPSLREWSTLSLVFLVLVVATIMVFSLRNRVDDLEDRMTTFETIRIEVVAPSQDGG